MATGYSTELNGVLAGDVGTVQRGEIIALARDDDELDNIECEVRNAIKDRIIEGDESHVTTGSVDFRVDEVVEGDDDTDHGSSRPQSEASVLRENNASQYFSKMVQDFEYDDHENGNGVLPIDRGGEKAGLLLPSSSTQNDHKTFFTRDEIEKENMDFRTRKQKQRILLRLQKHYGGPLALKQRNLSMETSLIELQFEEEVIDEDNAEENSIVTYKQALALSFTGIETLNSKYGPFELDGVSEALTSQFDRMDKPLRAIYRRYSAKKTNSPIMELAWIIIGTMLLHHFSKKMGSDSSMRDVFGKNKNREKDGEEKEEEEEDISKPPPQPSYKRRSQQPESSQNGGGLDLSSVLGVVSKMMAQ